MTTQQICRWRIIDDPEDFRQQALACVLHAAEAAIRARGAFHLVLAGGGTPREVYARLRAEPADWAAWHVYYGDERCLPADDPERNSRMAADAWLAHVPIPAAQVHVVAGELGAPAAAAAYAEVLRGVGDFDLVLLGLGEDGHTASLFPGNDPGAAAGSPDVVPVTNAPKPPPARVSLSAARLGRAHRVVFLVSGAGKRQALADWRDGRPIPASTIRPAAGVDVLVRGDALPA